MKLLKFFGAVGLALVLMVSIAFVSSLNSVKASLTENNPELQISTMVSTDGGQTYTTSPVCVKPGESFRYRVNIWNTGDTTADSVSGNGSPTNSKYISSVTANFPDEDGDGHRYRGTFCNPNDDSGYTTLVAARTTEATGQRMTGTVAVSPDAPCGTTFTCTPTITSYTPNQEQNGSQDQYGFNLVKKAFAAIASVTANIPSSYTVTVYNDSCPCGGRVASTSLPQTGNSPILELISSLVK